MSARIRGEAPVQPPEEPERPRGNDPRQGAHAAGPQWEVGVGVRGSPFSVKGLLDGYRNAAAGCQFAWPDTCRGVADQSAHVRKNRRGVTV